MWMLGKIAYADEGHHIYDTQRTFLSQGLAQKWNRSIFA